MANSRVLWKTTSLGNFYFSYKKIRPGWHALGVLDTMSMRVDELIKNPPVTLPTGGISTILSFLSRFYSEIVQSAHLS